MSDSIFDPALGRPRVPNALNPRGYVVGSAPSTRPTSSAHDAALIAILEAPLHAGETALIGFARKEAELRSAFAALSVIESRALQARLANPRSGDLLAAAFMRLTAERRARLINFLADARRREALAPRAKEGCHVRP